MSNGSALSCLVLVGLLLLHCLAVSAKLAVPVVAEKLPASSASSNKTGSQPLLGKLQLVSLLPDGMKNGLASGLAATVVKTCLQPFDTIKTLQQIQKVRLNPLEAGLRVVRARGFFSLWAGLGVTVLGSAPSTAVYFGVYSATKKRVLALIQPEYRLAGVAIAAIVGNSVATFLRVPCEVIKQRMQAGLHATALEAFQYSWTHEGPLGLFASGKLVSQLSRDIPYAVFCLVSYELIQGLLKNSISSSNDSPIIAAQKRKLKDAFAGSMAGGIGSIMTQPLDVVKTRLMTGNQQYKYTSVADAISRIAREEGLLTFFVGSAPRLMHKMPANGLFFLCYEVFRGILQVNDEPSS